MKRFVAIAFISLLFTQQLAWSQTPTAQIPTDKPTQESPPPQVLTSDPGNVSTQAPIIPLKGTEQLQLRLVNCSPGPDCFLAKRFLPASAHLNQLELKFDNPGPEAALILNTASVVQGTITDYPLPQDAFSIPNQELTLPPQAISTISLTLNRSLMEPEQYAGAIYLTQAGQSNRLVLPVNLSVRHGPLLPLVIILLGVILGRLFKYMQEQGGPQVELRKKLYQLEADVKATHPGDRQILRPMLQEARKRVYRQQLEVADTQITLLHSRLDVLTQLRKIEDRLYERQSRNEPIPDELFEDLQQARDLIAQGQDDEAKVVLDQILMLASARGRGATDEDLEDLEISLQAATVSLGKSSRGLVLAEKMSTTMDSLGERVQQFLVALAGLTDQVRAEATYWFVRPFLYLVLLVGLTIVGLNTLYIEKGATFGARPMADYLALLLWGLSADVASRSLSSLQGQEE